MLDAFIIEEIEKRRKEQEALQEQRIQLPLPEDEPRRYEDRPKEEDKRGVMSFEM